MIRITFDGFELIGFAVAVLFFIGSLIALIVELFKSGGERK